MLDSTFYPTRSIVSGTDARVADYVDLRLDCRGHVGEFSVGSGLKGAGREGAVASAHMRFDIRDAALRYAYDLRAVHFGRGR